MLKPRTVPPNLHLKTLNPNVDLSNFACSIPAPRLEALRWPRA